MLYTTATWPNGIPSWSPNGSMNTTTKSINFWLENIWIRQLNIVAKPTHPKSRMLIAASISNDIFLTRNCQIFSAVQIIFDNGISTKNFIDHNSMTTQIGISVI